MRKTGTLVANEIRDAVPATIFFPWLFHMIALTKAVSGCVDYFSLNYDQYNGSLANFQIAWDYRFTRHFGVGGGYRYVHYNLESTKSSWHGEIDYKFQGPMLVGVASF